MSLGRCQNRADDRPYVAGFGQGPAATSRPAAAKGKNRAASVPAASVATAMDLGDEEMVALPVSSGSRQSVNEELPTAILRNPQAYSEYVHAVRAEDSQPAEDSPLNQLMTTAWGRAPGHGPRCGAARAELCVLRLTTLMIFW